MSNTIEKSLRDEGRVHAVESWRHMFTSGRLNAWISESRNHTLDFHLEALVKIAACERPDDVIRVLDVGSGPISMLSKNFSGWNVELLAADALADDYAQLVDELGIDPERRLVRPVQAESEELSAMLGEKRFEFVIMRNALDHTADPVKSFEELMKVCAPGGYVLIEQFENEAKAEKWEGFHQWNMYFKVNTIILEGRDNDPIDLLAATSIANQRLNVWRSLRSSGKGWCGALLRRNT